MGQGLAVPDVIVLCAGLPVAPIDLLLQKKTVLGRLGESDGASRASRVGSAHQHPASMGTVTAG
jgi:hypothetical protein